MGSRSSADWSVYGLGACSIVLIVELSTKGSCYWDTCGTIGGISDMIDGMFDNILDDFSTDYINDYSPPPYTGDNTGYVNDYINDNPPPTYVPVTGDNPNAGDNPTNDIFGDMMNDAMQAIDDDAVKGYMEGVD